MECKRCGNKDKNYFYLGSRGYYCRKCIKFKRILLEEELYPLEYELSIGGGDYNFNFELTDKQKEASNKCKEYLKQSDVLLRAVCGAGKTEIMVESISSFLKQNKKVCFAIARREVVIELAERFKNIFPNNKVVGVYGGHHQNIIGDLIVCTTHQLFRYYQTFDLLILDEVDAFPLSGNITLMNIALNSAKGNIIFSSATVDDFLKEILSKRNYQEVNLYTRPSNKALTIPKVRYNFTLFNLLYLFFLLKKDDERYIIFVPTKSYCKYLYMLYKKFISSTYVYSDLENRDQNIKDFKEGKFRCIFATTVLERGITIPKINVIILDIYKNIFNEANIIQMLGRVGRSINHPFGKAYILSNHYNKDINSALKYLEHANSCI